MSRPELPVREQPASGPRYPEVEVRLSGCDGNAFNVLGRCRTRARQAGVTDAALAEFRAEATDGDYEHLLATTMRWFRVI